MRLDQRRRLLIAVDSRIALPAASLRSSVPGNSAFWSAGTSRRCSSPGPCGRSSPYSTLGDTKRRGDTRRRQSGQPTRVIVIACLISIVGVVLGLAHARNHSGRSSSCSPASQCSPCSSRGSRCTRCSCCGTRASTTSHRAGGIDFGGSTEAPDYMDFVYFVLHRRHDVPGLRHRHIASRTVRRAVASTCAVVVRVRHSHRRNRHQRRRQPHQGSATRATPSFESTARRGNTSQSVHHMTAVGARRPLPTWGPGAPPARHRRTAEGRRTRRGPTCPWRTIVAYGRRRGGHLRPCCCC